MKTFDIQPTDKSIQAVIQEKIDNLNKPKGALGRLEELAMQICLIQQIVRAASGQMQSLGQLTGIQHIRQSFEGFSWHFQKSPFRAHRTFLSNVPLFAPGESSAEKPMNVYKKQP